MQRIYVGKRLKSCRRVPEFARLTQKYRDELLIVV